MVLNPNNQLPSCSGQKRKGAAATSTAVVTTSYHAYAFVVIVHKVLKLDSRARWIYMRVGTIKTSLARILIS